MMEIVMGEDRKEKSEIKEEKMMKDEFRERS